MVFFALLIGGWVLLTMAQMVFVAVALMRRGAGPAQYVFALLSLGLTFPGVAYDLLTAPAADGTESALSRTALILFLAGLAAMWVQFLVWMWSWWAHSWTHSFAADPRRADSDRIARKTPAQTAASSSSKETR